MKETFKGTTHGERRGETLRPMYVDGSWFHKCNSHAILLHTNNYEADVLEKCKCISILYVHMIRNLLERKNIEFVNISSKY